MKRRIIFYCEDSFLLSDLAGLSEIFHLANRESALFEVHFYSLNGGTVEANTMHPLLTTTIKELIFLEQDIQMILGADSVDFNPTQPLRDLVLKAHNQNSWKQLIPWIKGKIGRPLFVEILDNHMEMSPRDFTGHCHKHFAQYPKKLIDAIRFRMALDLIEKTNHSLIYIAGCCGYARLDNMKCAFIKLIGQLPNDIRATSLSIPS